MRPRSCAFWLAASIASLSAFGQTSSTKQNPRSGRDTTRGSRAILPDPVLFDGSSLPAEKRPEHGMLGEFEIPGSEEKSDNAGKAQPDQTSAAGGSAAPTDDSKMASGGGSSDPGTGKPPENAAGGGGSKSVAQNDPKAKAECSQVGELIPNGNGGESADLAGLGEKPPKVALGDSAMQIKPIASSPAIVGSQQPAGNTQQSEKATSGGGKQGSGGGRGQGGVERGRTMPSGL